MVSDEDEVLLGTRDGMSIRFAVTQVRRMGRPARGVRGITLKEDDEVVGVVRPTVGTTILTICENGYGKRSNIDEYRVQGRGGSGIIDIRTTERNGKVIGILSVNDDHDVILSTSSAMIVRTAVGEISVIGRATQGVKLISVKDQDRVVSVAHVVKDDDEIEEIAGGDGAVDDGVGGDGVGGEERLDEDPDRNPGDADPSDDGPDGTPEDDSPDGEEGPE